jgi:hypothetical protein
MLLTGSYVSENVFFHLLASIIMVVHSILISFYFYYSMLSVCHFCIPNGLFVVGSRLNIESLSRQLRHISM